MPDWAYGSPAVSGGRVFVTSWDGTIAALSARTGTLLWRHKLPYNTISSPTVIGPYVYVADRGAGRHGNTYAFRVGDGRQVWHFPDGRFSTVIVGAAASSSPAPPGSTPSSPCDSRYAPGRRWACP